MADLTKANTPQIIYSVTAKRVNEGELFVRQHVFDYILSGQSDVFFSGKSIQFIAGDFRYALRNRLSKFSKIPPPDGEYRSISICIDQDTLLELAEGYQAPGNFRQEDNVIPLHANPLFKNYFDSLEPYLLNNNMLSERLIRTKVREVVLIMLDANPGLKNCLFDFASPGKIDLAAYMNAHYTFNGDLDQFAYLTGRSLSTFKRDFQSIFNQPPNKWLIQKRLEDAFFLIKEKNINPNNACYEAGFKDYSHFSIAFKRNFGFAPSHFKSRN